MIDVRVIHERPKAGPCVKAQVKATLISAAGVRYIGSNEVGAPQAACPRVDEPEFTAYEKCKSVCNQESHAEVSAILLAGDDALDSTIYLEGHRAACPGCQAAANAAGVKQIIVSPPPLVQ